MNAPVHYREGFLSPWTADNLMTSLWDRIDWVRHDKVPRKEYFISRQGQPYTYGQGAGIRTYQPQPSTPMIDILWDYVQSREGVIFDVCFLNGYENGSDHLGWHADDSPEMDDDRPISIVTLGGGREIWFRKNGTDEVDKLRLSHGSLCTMAPGMQDTHQHRIPKADRIVGKRISFTFRGLAG